MVDPKDDILPEFEMIPWDIQNQASCSVGAVLTEAWHFCKFFGSSGRFEEILWELILRDDLPPEGGHPKHLLWALYFLKVYPKQSLGCLVLGAAAGAVDPKTHCKWVWTYIKAIAKLVNMVASLLYFFPLFY